MSNVKGWPEHFSISDHGTVVGFTAKSDAGRQWWAENVNERDGAQLGGTVYADHRPAQDIVRAIEAEWPLQQD